MSELAASILGTDLTNGGWERCDTGGCVEPEVRCDPVTGEAYVAMHDSKDYGVAPLEFAASEWDEKVLPFFDKGETHLEPGAYAIALGGTATMAVLVDTEGGAMIARSNQSDLIHEYDQYEVEVFGKNVRKGAATFAALSARNQ